MKMKAKIDADACIGCGLCVSTCPEVYKMDSDKAVVSVDVVPKEAEDNCQKAADECPVTAIVVTK
ncbi:MAG: ferredoxin [Candidatus Omnitrophota bacterium]